VTKSGLARQLGVNPEVVRSALRFGSLPDQFQDEVRDGRISFGRAVLLERLAESIRDSKGNKNKAEVSREIHNHLMK